jgi:tetratricopeptide (TPR) repeat protein
MCVLAGFLLGLVATVSVQAPADWQEGARALEAGQYEVAVEVFASITRASPEVAAGHFNLGLAHEGLGEHQLAVECLQRAVTLDLEAVTYRIELARILLNIGRVREAQDALEAVDLDTLEGETRSQVAVLLAQAATRIGRASDAVRLLRARLDIDPDDAQLHHALGVALDTVGEHAAALDEMVRACDLDPSSELYALAAVHVAFASARAASATRPAETAYVRAAELAERLARLRPSFDHLLLAGEGWMEAEQCVRALKWFELAQRRQARNTLVLLYIGRCYASLGEHRRALEELQRALRIGARGTLRARIYEQLGEVYLALDELDWAISAYSQAGDRERVRELIERVRSRGAEG